MYIQAQYKGQVCMQLQSHFQGFVLQNMMDCPKLLRNIHGSIHNGAQASTRCDTECKLHCIEQILEILVFKVECWN